MQGLNNRLLKKPGLQQIREMLNTALVITKAVLSKMLECMLEAGMRFYLFLKYLTAS